MNSQLLSSQPEQQTEIQPELAQPTSEPEVITSQVLRQTLGFVALYQVQDPIQREYQTIQGAKHYEIPLDSYRLMFKNYCQEQQEAQASGWQVPMLRVERGFEQLASCLSEMDFFKVLEYLAKLSTLSILVGVVSFFIGIQRQAEQNRKELVARQQQQIIQEKTSQYEAWRIITTNQGTRASGGRIEAIEDLNEANVSLAGLNIKNAYLPRLVLQGADLHEANLKRTTLEEANFSKAILVNANLRHAILPHANLTRATLLGSDLTKADLTNANLSFADLGAEEGMVGADLRETDLTGADLSYANLRGVRNLTVAQVKAAKNWQMAIYDSDFRQQLGLRSVEKP